MMWKNLRKNWNFYQKMITLFRINKNEISRAQINEMV